MVAIGLSKQLARYADPKAIEQISFTGDLENQSTIFSLLQKRKKLF